MIAGEKDVEMGLVQLEAGLNYTPELPVYLPGCWKNGHVIKSNREWVHLIADHQARYLHGETEKIDVDIYSAFVAASVEQGKRAYPSEARAMAMVFDVFYTDKSEAFKSIYLNVYLCTWSLHSSSVLWRHVNVIKCIICICLFRHITRMPPFNVLFRKWA